MQGYWSLLELVDAMASRGAETHDLLDEIRVEYKFTDGTAETVSAAKAACEMARQEATLWLLKAVNCGDVPICTAWARMPPVLPIEKLDSYFIRADEAKAVLTRLFPEIKATKAVQVAPAKATLLQYQRLEPKTEFTGGRITEFDLLTLEEAAEMASRHAREKITPVDFLRAAARGEIRILAITPRRAKVSKPDGSVCCNQGTPDENICPQGAILPLPLSACRSLANVGGSALWRTIERLQEMDEMWFAVPDFSLADDEPDFQTTLMECRVSGDNVFALADAFLPTPTASSSPVAVTPMPMQRTAARDAAVLAAIRQQGHEPQALPAWQPGAPGVKAKVKQALEGNPLFTGSKVFNKAWERLRAAGDIADA